MPPNKFCEEQLIVEVSKEEFDKLLVDFTRGARETETPARYRGLWYLRADGTTIGIRRSRKLGQVIEIIDSLDNPKFRPGMRFFAEEIDD